VSKPENLEQLLLARLDEVNSNDPARFIRFNELFELCKVGNEGISFDGDDFLLMLERFESFGWIDKNDTAGVHASGMRISARGQVQNAASVDYAGFMAGKISDLPPLPDDVEELPDGRTLLAQSGTDIQSSGLRPGDIIYEYDAGTGFDDSQSEVPAVKHDSSEWTGTQFVLVDAKVIAAVRDSASALRQAVYSLHLPSNSDTDDLQKLADALLKICEMTEPDVSIIDRITASPKFRAIASLMVLVATIRGAAGI
jgi:hypothetical protein